MDKNNVQRIPKSQWKVSQWAGGSSSQIMIWPEDATYADRNFLFRISTAQAVTDEESDYTHLPGVTRHLLMLEGKAVVCHKDRYTLTMHPHKEIDIFDGGWDTCASGKVRDFNLMTRSGCDGTLSVLSQSTALNLSGNSTYTLLFCSEGSGELLGENGPSYSIEKDDSLLLHPDEKESWKLELAENSHVICVSVTVNP